MAVLLLFIGAGLLITAAVLTGSWPLTIAVVGVLVLLAGVDVTRGGGR